MTTGERIKIARKKAALTQAELGMQLGVSGSMIAQYETGKRVPKYEQLVKIAAALKINPFDLLPEDVKKQFENVPTFFNSSDEKNRSLARETEKVLIENEINKEIYEKLWSITTSVYSSVMKGLESISDEELKSVLLGSFNSLNRYGKREAVERVAELELIPKYKADSEE